MISSTGNMRLKELHKWIGNNHMTKTQCHVVIIKNISTQVNHAVGKTQKFAPLKYNKNYRGLGRCSMINREHNNSNKATVGTQK